MAGLNALTASEHAVGRSRRLVTRLAALLLLVVIASYVVQSANSRPESTGATRPVDGRPDVRAPRSRPPVLSTRVIPRLGTVLVAGNSHTLYTYAPDQRRRVTCVSSCAPLFPSLVESSTQMAISGGARRGLISSLHVPGVGRVLTYAGWPLYTYVGDTKPGEAAAQGVVINGGLSTDLKRGLWHAIAPSGRVITTVG